MTGNVYLYCRNLRGAGGGGGEREIAYSGSQGNKIRWEKGRNGEKIESSKGKRIQRTKDEKGLSV